MSEMSPLDCSFSVSVCVLACKCRRGSYCRKTCAKPTSHAEQAWKHLQKVQEFAIGRPCTASCMYNRMCAANVPLNLLILAHQHSYGKHTTMDVGLNGMAPQYHVELCKKETMRRWRYLAASAMSWAVLDDRSTMVERLTVCDIGPVCSAFWRAAYGIPEGTANTLLAAARAGTLKLDLDDDFCTVNKWECVDVLGAYAG